MAKNPAPTLVLNPLRGRPRTVREQLTTFHLMLAVVDPYRRDSKELVGTIRRILHNFKQADCRTAILVGGDEASARKVLGSIADEFLVFLDDDHAVIKGLGLERLPALIHLGIDGQIVNSSEGWNPAEWDGLAQTLADMMHWQAPLIPVDSDPLPMKGSPVA